jgi:hypothetical protein
VGTFKILARYKGSTISLQAAVHLGHMPRALMTKKKKKKKVSEKRPLIMVNYFSVKRSVFNKRDICTLCSSVRAS